MRSENLKVWCIQCFRGYNLRRKSFSPNFVSSYAEKKGEAG